MTVATKNIEEVQNEIIDDFDLLDGDRESTIFYIMELGQELPKLDEQYMIDENLIKGCQSKVWLTTDFQEGRIIYSADSNTDITKGLISLLIRVLNNRTPQEIINADLFFFEKIGMNGVIGSQRSNGFASMIKQMKFYALAYSAKS
ncbi:SufE family protein [Flammeovirga kamogawensis]|uniref:SufE family protein n=1 Tax=Flammeovirga kamogawensis TaxID=373891 RepID=A0ABX8GQW1_9BACT|nr:SufE family protein [Flammeovirga kamogawensis]MBB6462158.1 cysteine desulfuration protein SufE [Flammeovirga kamogawensis]QWG05891.1 SufE family protein [Flammeovirga kamogawensis]TRX67716.1 SufE family protein [Flammeovirga kamogawensis]